MTTSNEELIKAVNELKAEIQRIREVVDLLLNVVIEGEMEEELGSEFRLGSLKDIDPSSMYN